ncbi:DUF4255 domain-containing protein [Methylicorpusculum oleiharenae]|uniref:DUF4255 domain-containing protein n=1 Tax=Methylicorpusculum oleiharenae TaxID=1338687 RepID=UPI00135CBF43|nr:DUF4255 domain-containing protein [Methylicorpusculum oleiharenae]MCD2449911.1 DUF4255 domain-containing protein [Methylicorpusculum oleiharenae]
MISHALTIVLNELNRHLTDNYGADAMNAGRLGNLAEGFGSGGINPRDVLYLSLVNIKEEKSLKNLPHYTRNDVTLRALYENPPTFLNFQILVVASHSNYTNALLMLSRAIRFFQAQNVFTQDTVDPGSITANAPGNALDQLESFKLIFDLYSPTMEEVNHLWGTLGGKQYPFVMYVLRMLDLRFRAVQSESGLITEIDHDFRHKTGTDNFS